MPENPAWICLCQQRGPSSARKEHSQTTAPKSVQQRDDHPDAGNEPELFQKHAGSRVRTVGRSRHEFYGDKLFIFVSGESRCQCEPPAKPNDVGSNPVDRYFHFRQQLTKPPL